MEPVFGNEPIETSDGEAIDRRISGNWGLNYMTNGRGYRRVYFKEPRSILKSGKGKKQASAYFNFATGRLDRADNYGDRYISLRNVEDMAAYEFDV